MKVNTTACKREVVLDDDGNNGSPKEKKKKRKREGSFLSNRGNNRGDTICVEEYSEERELNFAILASVFLTPGPSVTEMGESSFPGVEKICEAKENMFVCEICADYKAHHESFTIKGCAHSYCFDCMRNYIVSKLDNGISQINCPVPSCHGLLEPEYCHEILPPEVFDRWGSVLCESMILSSQKFYCPFKDCSVLLVDDGEETVTRSECPNCWRLFCAQCKAVWHEGIVCEEYQKLSMDERGKEDIMLRELARNKKWQRCPTCKFYVERTEGCLFMKCRCGVAFCYNCGTINTDHRYHHCSRCNRRQAVYEVLLVLHAFDGFPLVDGISWKFEHRRRRLREFDVTNLDVYR
ncbi:hypothetical protein Nepgr_005968 [Nepenthes gracilis]|uniref:RBR-type E3 ubiquitin transferase n=1 Tax=Nepenthes gracilis TaxID=150966 RepID=A0AAD3S459_NEPGR|nr:hypothetical protein Nepgr_005968 [Nepenthes gracilis]